MISSRGVCGDHRAGEAAPHPLSPVHGLYALLLPAVLYMLLGSSRQLIVGPEGAIAALVGTAVLPMAVAGSGEAAELAAVFRCS